MPKVNFQKELDDLISKLNGKRPALLLHACCGPCSSYCLEYLAKYFRITVYYYNPNIYPPEEYYRRLNELKNLYKTFPPALEGGVQTIKGGVQTADGGVLAGKDRVQTAECGVQTTVDVQTGRGDVQDPAGDVQTAEEVPNVQTAVPVQVVEAEYDPEQYYAAIGIKENPELAKEPEKGERCRRCYKLRMERAYNYAKANGFDYFCTTLSISPFKDAVKINAIGKELSAGGAAVQGDVQAEQTDVPAAGSAAVVSDAAISGDVSIESEVPQWLPSDFKKNGGFVRSLEISKEYGMYRQDYCGCIYSYQSRQEWLARACSGAQQPD